MEVIKKRVKHYVRNIDLYNEVVYCKDTNELSPVLTEYFRLIADRLITKLYFRDPMDRDDVFMGGWEDACIYWRKFDPSIGRNAFAYYTQIIKNGFAKGYNANYGKRTRFKVTHITLNNIHSL